MGYASLSDLKAWLEQPAGTCEDSALLALANDCRQFLYNEYEDMALFRDAVECFEVQRFCESCVPCGASYLGITLPRYMQTVEAIWFGHSPVAMQSSWREYQTGIASECSCGLQEFDMGSVYPSERDILPDRVQRLKVMCMDAADAGKKITLTGKDAFGDRDASETISLTTEYQLTTVPFSMLRRPGGFQKPRTAGRVVLADEEGRILSIYAPDETIPAYKRIKITGIPADCAQVNIRAARRYFPLYNDFDVVESDNKLGFEELARYFRLNRKADKDVNDLQAMKLHVMQARAHFKGERAREFGKGTRAELKIASLPFTRSHSLRRNRRF